jgi:hypothetical protein
VPRVQTTSPIHISDHHPVSAFAASRSLPHSCAVTWHVLGQHIVLWFSRFLNCNFPFKRCLPVHQTAGWSCNLPFSTGRPWNLFGTGRILWCLVWVLTSWRCLAFHSQSTSFPWYPHYMSPHHENNHHPYLFMGGERTKKTKKDLTPKLHQITWIITVCSWENLHPKSPV